MAVITTGSFAKLIYPGLNAVWGMDQKDHPKEYTALFDVETSDRNYEEDLGTQGFGLAAVKAEGGPISYDEAKQTYVTRYVHTVYGIGFIITREMMEDDLYGKIGKKRATALSRSINQTIETVGANVYNRAFNASYTGGDGKELVATDHPTASGNQSNELTTAADLSEVAIEQLVIQIMQATDERGLKQAIMPRSLIVHPNEAFNATRILKSALQNDTANNAINAIKAQGVFPEGVKINHYFSDTDAWFIRTNAMDGMKFFMRRKPAFETDGDFDSENAKFKGTVRFSCGWSDWRGVYGTPGA